MTGAAGYIGIHVVNALVDAGADVIALSRSGAHPNPNVHSVQSDFADIDAETLAEWGPPDVIVHLAWTDGFEHNARSHIENLPAHLRLVVAAMKAGVRQFAGLGTMHEIGYWEGEIDETTPSRPRSLYGIAKNAFRDAARLEVDRAEAVFQWLRPYYILGDDERNNSIFTKILKWDAEGKLSFPFTSGANGYDFIDVKTLAQQIAAASLQDKIVGVIECCSGEAIPLRDQVEAFIFERRLRIRPDYGAFPDRPYDSPGVWGSTKKIAQIMDQRKKRRYEPLQSPLRLI